MTTCLGIQWHHSAVLWARAPLLVALTGLPMVYYVGLPAVPAGRNDHEVEKSIAATSSWQLFEGLE